jgi:hypothetical protein
VQMTDLLPHGPRQQNSETLCSARPNMARSRKKTPICGITTARSEKQDQLLANRRVRRAVKQTLATSADSEFSYRVAASSRAHGPWRRTVGPGSTRRVSQRSSASRLRSPGPKQGMALPGSRGVEFRILQPEGSDQHGRVERQGTGHRGGPRAA